MLFGILSLRLLHPRYSTENTESAPYLFRYFLRHVS